jgi:hypothetical protein
MYIGADTTAIKTIFDVHNANRGIMSILAINISETSLLRNVVA